MQPRCRRGGRALALCIYGLITLAIRRLILSAYVGRQWNVPRGIKDIVERPGEFYEPSDPTPIQYLHPVAGLQLYILALSQPAGRPDQRLAYRVLLLQKKYLHPSARLPAAEEPGRDHLCVVQDEAISGLEIFDYISKDLMRYLPGLSVQGHQPATIPLCVRILGDEVPRQRVIKFR